MVSGAVLVIKRSLDSPTSSARQLVTMLWSSSLRVVSVCADSGAGDGEGGIDLAAEATCVVEVEAGGTLAAAEVEAEGTPAAAEVEAGAALVDVGAGARLGEVLDVDVEARAVRVPPGNRSGEYCRRWSKRPRTSESWILCRERAPDARGFVSSGWSMVTKFFKSSRILFNSKLLDRH